GKKVLEYTDSVLEKGISIEQFVINLTEYFRNLLFLKHGIKKDYILGYSVDTFPGDIIDAFPISHLESAMELLLELYRTFRFSISQKFELELLMSRLASLNKLITRQELLEELKQIKTDILEGPRNSESESESTITNELSESPHETSTEKDSNIIVNLIQYLHTEKKIALVSALEKLESWNLKNDEFSLVFNTQNKFAGELLKKEKVTLSNILSETFGLSVKIFISFNKVEQNDQEQKDQRVEILKNIFQGEIVEGKE
ncbi:MAG: hypothetical protein OQK82_04220, partial [Candidatus Pacearchaeota archaeon]|nr:hypothetical protein [Candidatus Pacearchaeota archaeon]